MESGMHQLHTPKQISEYAQACLAGLVARGMGKMISLGGAFGLSYYYEYRSTHDIDAWWEEGVSEEDRRAFVRCIEEALGAFGQVRTRSWGDVSSVELAPSGQEGVAFSFQIARRSARLEKPVQVPWPEGMQVDSLDDLLASKMVALVERGAPRDFRDLYTFCQANLATPQVCWELWKRRQRLARSDADAERARLAVLTHLKRISTQRPLDRIVQPDEREAAARLREWFGKDFLDALLD